LDNSTPEFMFRHKNQSSRVFNYRVFAILSAILAAILNSKMGDSRCTLARGLIMFLDPENIGVTDGITSFIPL